MLVNVSGMSGLFGFEPGSAALHSLFMQKLQGGKIVDVGGAG